MVTNPACRTDNRQKVVTTSVQDVLKDAMETNFNCKSSLDRFINNHSARLNPSAETVRAAKKHKNDDVLHKLCGIKDTAEFNKYNDFVQWIIECRPTLLDRKGDFNMTPLHLAIGSKNNKFIKMILDRCRDVGKLFMEPSESGNCLHHAIFTSNPLTYAIIEKCQSLRSLDHIYEANNHQGMTALHLAVSFTDEDDINEAQCQPDVDLSAQAPSPSTKSPKDMAAKGTSTPDHRLYERNDANIKRNRNTVATGETETRTKPPATAEQEPKYNKLQVIKLLIEANERVLVDCQDKDGRTPFQLRLNEMVLDKFDPQDISSAEEIDVNRDYLIENDKILRYLRQYIIEKFDRKDAKKALYKVGAERALDFNLFGHSSTITDAFLTHLGRIIQFEQTLQYVGLPRLAIKYTSDTGSNQAKCDWNAGNATQTATGTSTVRHMCHLFAWLRNKGVKSIMRLDVIDDAKPCHSDEAIEECLKGLDVQIWNWCKWDLCSDVIINCATNAREVTLYSSGNNAVLKGWSSPSGLAKLEKLERVYVVIGESPESPDRLKNNKERFEEQLEQSIRSRSSNAKVIVEFKDKTNEGYNSIFKGRDAKNMESRWMSSLQNFGKFLELTEKRAGKQHSSMVKPVKIAVIDDGINTGLSIFTNRIEKGESFYQFSEDFGYSGQFYVPASQHGTQMAKLICQVCPVVKLHIAQLEVLPGQEGRRSFNHDSATEAIEWAINQDVDIISMSWSINASKLLTRLEAALDEAARRKIIMFCASIDEGVAAQDYTYPGKAKVCIKIGASTSTGAKLSWVSDTSAHYLFPGDLLLPDTRDDPVLNPYAPPGPSGSSVSTALAAGLAGVLLYCDRLIGTPPAREACAGSATGREIDSLKQRGEIEKAFDKLSTLVDNRNKFVQVWDKWEKLGINRARLADWSAWNPEKYPEKAEEIKSKIREFMNEIRVAVEE